MKPLNFARIAILGMALMTFAGLAVAQQGGGNPPPPPPGDPRVFVVKMSTVQQHLQLTAEQIRRINEMHPPGPGGPGGGGPGGGGPGGGGPGGGGPGGGGPGGGGQNDPLAQILNQNQLHRLHQLTVQFNAPMSVFWKMVNPELQLTQEQRREIDQIIRTNVPPPEPGTRPEWAEMQRKKAHAFELVWAVFTQNQKTKWNQLTGAAFNNWVEPPPPPGR